MSELATTICGHLHRLEWVAPMPRTRACLPCTILAVVVARTHGKPRKAAERCVVAPRTGSEGETAQSYTDVIPGDIGTIQGGGA